MITSIVILSLVGTFPYWTAQSSPGDHDAIKITVNEHFNGEIGTAQLGPDTQMLSPVIPNYVHQGTNFFFNPRLLVSPGYVTGHIEAVIASLKENNNTSTIEIPLATEPATTTDKQNLTEAPEITTEKQILEEIVETIKPPCPPDQINNIIDEPLEIPPPPQPIIHEGTIVDIPMPLVIPVAPELPPLNLTIPIIVEERPTEVVIEPVLAPLELPEPPVLEDQTILGIPSISEIPTAPELPPLELPVLPEHILIEEIHKPKPHYVEDIITIKDELIIPKPQKLFGLISSVSIVEQKCKPCFDLPNNVPVEVQELPLILSDIVKPIPSGKPKKTIVLLPTISELPLAPIPRLPIDVEISEKIKSTHLVFPTACAHNIIAERVVPNIILSKKSPKHLKLLSVPAALKFPVK